MSERFLGFMVSELGRDVCICIYVRLRYAEPVQVSWFGVMR